MNQQSKQINTKKWEREENKDKGEKRSEENEPSMINVKTMDVKFTLPKTNSNL